MKKFINLLKENLSFMITVVLISIIVNSLVMVNQVVGVSMYPTYENGNLLFSTRIVTNVDRGDIVAIHSEVLNEDIIKRVIAIPGDKISYIDGVLTINDEVVVEEYINDDAINGEYEIEEITVSENSYIVMGDNRNNSSDSRHFGLINKEEIFGKVLFKIY